MPTPEPPPAAEAPAPSPEELPPPPVVSPDEPVGAKERTRVRWAALFGCLGCVVIVAAWFLPWIHVPEGDRRRVLDALRPRVEALPKTGEAADHASRFGVVEESVEKGHFTGLDLFHYLRSAWALNRWYVGPEPRDATGGQWWTQRTLLLGAVLLAALPVVALLMTSYFLTHGFRRAASPMLILMTLVGVGAGMATIGWLRFTDLAYLPLPAGLGLQATAGAAVVLALAGVFGVTARNWWRVYAGAAATLGALAVLAWAYVSGGEMP